MLTRRGTDRKIDGAQRYLNTYHLRNAAANTEES